MSQHHTAGNGFVLWHTDRAAQRLLMANVQHLLLSVGLTDELQVQDDKWQQLDGAWRDEEAEWKLQLRQKKLLVAKCEWDMQCIRLENETLTNNISTEVNTHVKPHNPHS